MTWLLEQRPNYSGFHKADIYFSLNRPRGRWPRNAIPPGCPRHPELLWSFPRVLPLLIWLKMAPTASRLRNSTVGKGMTWRFCLCPVNQACGHTLPQGKKGNAVFSCVAMCPATPWRLHYQNGEAEIGYWETSDPMASGLERCGLNDETPYRELRGF